MMGTDMSSRAVTARLRRTSQLRDLCLRLGKARRPTEHKSNVENASQKDGNAGSQIRKIAEAREEYSQPHDSQP
jgi:hypothetical protein